jgi:hypothetical protein
LALASAMQLEVENSDPGRVSMQRTGMHVDQPGTELEAQPG